MFSAVNKKKFFYAIIIRIHSMEKIFKQLQECFLNINIFKISRIMNRYGEKKFAAQNF